MNGNERKKRRTSRRSALRERRRGAGLRSCWATNEVPAQNFSYPRLPSLQDSITTWSQARPDRGRDLVTANNRSGIVPHDVIPELDIRKLKRGCFNPRRGGTPEIFAVADKIAWKEPQAQKARRYWTRELAWNRGPRTAEEE